MLLLCRMNADGVCTDFCSCTNKGIENGNNILPCTFVLCKVGGSVYSSLVNAKSPYWYLYENISPLL